MTKHLSLSGALFTNFKCHTKDLGGNAFWITKKTGTNLQHFRPN